jgi:membrane-associated phospholipid phosphatase
MTRGVVAAVCLAAAIWPAPAAAQPDRPSPDAAGSASSAVPAASAGLVAGQSERQPGATRRLHGDVLHDYRDFLSVGTSMWLATGGIAAADLHLADEALREETAEATAPLVVALEGGATYGNLTFQVPLAVGWWAIGHAVGPRHAEAGRDLLRAQILALGYNYALNYAVDRTRPNGDPRSFPSGHATATFATAMVLQEHYGWKVGVPAFAAAAYTAASRITVNKHWASDVVFGAALGMASGRTVTLHLRQNRVALAPLAVPGGGGVIVRVTAENPPRVMPPTGKR